MAAARQSEADRRPIAAPAGSVTPVSGTPIAQICHKLVINVTTALTSFSIRTLDGNASALGALPVGLWTFDVQFDEVTWAGGTVGGIVAFYHFS
jgi:hypothetical protein